MKRGRLEIFFHESAALADNPLGDPHVREVGVYLPPSYEGSTQRFPTLTLLTGYGSTGLSLCNRSGWETPLPRRLDGLIARGDIGETLVVLPDCFSAYGGSQYVDSPALGRYQTYLVEVLAAVEARYRALPEREARGIAGKSSGGYGALVAGMLRSDFFGAVGSHAGDCAFELSYARELPGLVVALERKGGVEKFLAWFDGLVAKPRAAVEVMSLFCCAAAWSPTSSGPYGYGRGFDLPCDLRSGARLAEVWARWLAWDPVRMVARHAPALSSLRGLYIDAGNSDEFFLQLGARQVVDELTRAGVAHLHEEFEGGHLNTQWRYDRLIQATVAALAR